MQYSKLILVLLALAVIVSPTIGMGASTTINANGAIAPAIQLTALTDLDFGELVIPAPGTAGYFEIDAATGAPTAVNANQVGASTSRGSFTISGRTGVNVNLTITEAGFACDTAYIGPCVGTPTLTLANTFTSTGTGQITATSCTGVKCTDTVYVGGRFSFSGTEEGRWTNTLTVTANYQ